MHLLRVFYFKLISLLLFMKWIIGAYLLSYIGVLYLLYEIATP